MRFYQQFVVTRNTNLLALMETVKGFDPTATVIDRRTEDGKFFLGKATGWTAAQINNAAAVIETSPLDSPQLRAQQEIDAWPVALKALVLSLVDQINVLRTASSLPAITPAQAFQAIRNKAGQL